MNELLKPGHWFDALQWLLFMFTNTVVIPITVGAAFGLAHLQLVGLMQISFIVGGLACIAQAFLGHRRPIMEGQSGLWWAVMLSLAFSAAAQGVPLAEVGGSLAVGIFISALLNVAIGLSGAGWWLARLFNPGVMGVFMFLFGAKLIAIFLQGMLGLPFDGAGGAAPLDVAVSLLSIAIAALVAVISIKAPAALARYSLLIGLVFGWLAYVVVFRPAPAQGSTFAIHLELFPLGWPAWNVGIIVTAVITGLLNLANTFGALKGTEPIYGVRTSRAEYRRSLTVSGVLVGVAGLLGLVPYAPYVSSIGFLDQTGILKRLPYVLGGVLFLLVGAIAPLGQFFSLLPLSVGAAVLFVPYLLLFNASQRFFSQIRIDAGNAYRAALPLFVGVVIMTLPAATFTPIPEVIRPLVSSGMLVGIMLALALENLIDWEAPGVSGESTAAGRPRRG